MTFWNKQWYRFSKKASLYQRVFSGREAEFVLADLAKFCHMGRPTTKVNPISGAVDSHATLQAEGRREVFLRILAHLNLTHEDVARMRQIEETYNTEDEAIQ